MRTPLLVALLMLAPAVLANDIAADAPEAWGQPLPAGSAQSIDAALAAFDAKVDAKPGKFQGRIVDVCSKRGCWAMLEADGKSARVMPREHEFMVPRDVRGEAVVYGTLASIDLSESRAKFAAENPGKANPIPEQEYRIEALGIEMVE